ncbi:hypothetical protein ACFL21_00240 [Patescibacteria group bacterium]
MEGFWGFKYSIIKVGNQKKSYYFVLDIIIGPTIIATIAPIATLSDTKDTIDSTEGDNIQNPIIAIIPPRTAPRIPNLIKFDLLYFIYYAFFFGFIVFHD